MPRTPHNTCSHPGCTFLVADGMTTCLMHAQVRNKAKAPTAPLHCRRCDVTGEVLNADRLCELCHQQKAVSRKAQGELQQLLMGALLDHGVMDSPLVAMLSAEVDEATVSYLLEPYTPGVFATPQEDMRYRLERTLGFLFRRMSATVRS